MAGNLITLPLRVSFRAARALTRVAAGTTELAVSVVGRTIGAVAPSPPTPRTTAPPPPAAPAPSSGNLFREPEAKVPPAGAAEKTPIHVSAEPELVREVAEAGAEDGAGAAITVAEPWNGYRRMSAKDVIARARTGNAAELAAVRLYESRHRSRQTVLAAVDRQLKLVSSGAPA
jgi:hypothetical protein